MATTYVALLRGINVGGNNIIKMVDLKAVFEELGFTQVRTYIQSGNVLFSAQNQSSRTLEKKIEPKLSAAFNYKARVLVRSQAELAEIVAHFPPIFKDAGWKHNVLFLSHVLDAAKLAKKLAIKPKIEQLHPATGVLFWSSKLSDLTRSEMIKLSRHPEYQEMTIRNVNTTRKLLTLMENVK